MNNLKRDLHAQLDHLLLQEHALTAAEVVHTDGRYIHALLVPVCTPGFDLSSWVSAQEALHHLAGAKPDHAEDETLKVPEQHSMLSKRAKQVGRSAAEGVQADAARAQKVREPEACVAARSLRPGVVGGGLVKAACMGAVGVP
ncbi:hypothetical protein ABBQ32_005707 [Trebouxia sp. C0010 RCD-2024]